MSTGVLCVPIAPMSESGNFIHGELCFSQLQIGLLLEHLKTIADPQTFLHVPCGISSP